MNAATRPILEIPQTVIQDTEAYRDQVQRFVAGQVSPDVFRARRVPMGVYEQRTAGRFMVRVRVGAGLIMPIQLDRLAELSKTYGNGVLHVTTRQDIQIHDVAIDRTPEILDSLLEVGLSSRGGGGNTVRNVTACPRAGVCPKEVFDVAPHAIAVAEYLLADRTSFNLPRKYKIAFSGCEEDCAYASVADLGFFAHREHGVEGFGVYAAGGLGSNPAVAVKIEDFVPAAEVFEVAEAIKRLFDEQGDRADKRKARLRYVLARLGPDEFIRLYRQKRRAIRSAGLDHEPLEFRSIARRYPVREAPARQVATKLRVLDEKTPGRVSVELRLNNGDIPADDLRAVGRIAERYGQGLVRTTQLQNLLISGVAQRDVVKVESELRSLSVDVLGGVGPDVVACAGAATCKLGLCLSRSLADAIRDKFNTAEARLRARQTVIRISGCANSCGQHYISEIGLQGSARRVNGRLMPFYEVLAGGRTAEGEARLAKSIGSVPAKRIPDLLYEALGDDDPARRLERLVAGCAEAGQTPPEDYYRDFGSDEPFSLAGRGPGECGAGVMDVIRVDIEQAKLAVKSVPVTDQSVYRATLAAARALLVVFGVEPKTDREVFEAFGKNLIEAGWVEPKARMLLDAAIDWRMGDRDSLTDLREQVGRLVERVEQLFLSLDSSLKFRLDKAGSGSATDLDETVRTIDLRGVACPMNFVKAKLALERIPVGETIDILLDGGQPVKNAPASLAQQGQQIVEIVDMGGYFRVKVRRKK